MSTRLIIDGESRIRRVIASLMADNQKFSISPVVFQDLPVDQWEVGIANDPDARKSLERGLTPKVTPKREVRT